MDVLPNVQRLDGSRAMTTRRTRKSNGKTRTLMLRNARKEKAAR
jgi:hypothetical protein